MERAESLVQRLVPIKQVTLPVGKKPTEMKAMETQESSGAEGGRAASEEQARGLLTEKALLKLSSALCKPSKFSRNIMLSSVFLTRFNIS